MFKPGDIGAIGAKPQEKALNRLIRPYSDRWHHFLIGEATEDGDYEIFESMANLMGVRIGRLSFYKDWDLKFFRYPDANIARKSTLVASKWGRADYDFMQFGRLLATATSYWMQNGFKPVPYYQFEETTNLKLICTELVTQAFEGAGGPIVAPRIVGTPASIQNAVDTGILVVL